MTLWVRVRSEDAPRPLDETAFRSQLGVTYASHLVFATPTDERRVRAQCERLRARELLTAEQLWLGAYYKQQLATAASADLMIAWINPVIGYGLFAKSSLSVGDFISEYTGLVKPKSLLSWRPKDYLFRYPTAEHFWRKYVIDSEVVGNESRFINHSDNPNAEAASVWHEGLLHIVMRASRAIPAGEQITFDYGRLFWRHRKAPLEL